jgi:hypothetical protein
VAKDTAGKPLFSTIAGIVNAGILAECDKVEQAFLASYRPTKH